MKRIIINSIRCYQKILSPDKGWLKSVYQSPIFSIIPGQIWGCRFSPTCSEYAVTQLSQHGVFVGLIKTIRRLIKCF